MRRRESSAAMSSSSRTETEVVPRSSFVGRHQVSGPAEVELRLQEYGALGQNYRRRPLPCPYIVARVLDQVRAEVLPVGPLGEPES